jgi:hypothetical protein
VIKTIVAFIVGLSTVGMWFVVPLSRGYVSIMILVLAILLMWLGYLIPSQRVFLVSLGFYALMTGGFASYSNWLPQVRGEVPEEVVIPGGDIDSMSAEELSEMGEQIIFGRVTGGNPNDSDVGKGQCPLCHTVSGTVRRDRGPDLTAADDVTKVPIGQRGAIRLEDSRYKNPDSVQTESSPGSGRATTPLEYIAESHACPDCFVVAGFGEKGTNDKNSPMPTIHKAPISLSINELIAVDTYLFNKDGLDVPSVSEIRAAYEKFIPVADRPEDEEPSKKKSGEDLSVKLALPTDTPQDIIKKMACHTCHQIPQMPGANIGVIGPMLIEGHNAKRRIASAPYKSDIKAGTAAARSPRDYVMESIMDPNAHVVMPFGIPGNSAMPKNFNERFTVGALNNLIDFLLSLDCQAAKDAGLNGPPQEPITKVCG